MSFSEGATPTILVIDDEASILRLLKALLTRSLYQVTTADNAKEALELLDKGHFDCVITDAIMPDLSGYDFVKALRSRPRFEELPVLMLTRKRHRQDVKKAVEAGVTDYIFKPIDENLLMEKIEHCLKKNNERRGSSGWVFSGAESKAELGVACRLDSLSESILTLHLPFKLGPAEPLNLKSDILSEIGVDPTHFRLESCERTAAKSPELPWEAKLRLNPAKDADAQRVRAWLEQRKGQRSRA